MAIASRKGRFRRGEFCAIIIILYNSYGLLKIQRFEIFVDI